MRRLNILICRVVDDARVVTAGGQRRRQTGIEIVIRDGYQWAEHLPGRTRIFIDCVTRHDPTAINNLGQRGASVVVIPDGAVETAVAELRAEWGNVPVQDNSGRYPHLATAPGVLVL